MTVDKKMRTPSVVLPDDGVSGHSAQGYVTEMFCSVQGEGLYVGERHAFLRTAGCSATCYWCDTVRSKTEQTQCVIHGPDRTTLDNPLSAGVTAEALLDLIEMSGPVRAVSLTGGEPLEQSAFLVEVSRRLKNAGQRIYLETSGLEVAALKTLRPFVDIVAMDIKLPSATGQEHWRDHREFMTWLVGTDFFIKIVIDHGTPAGEIDCAVRLIEELDPTIPLVLQPESSTFLKGRSGTEARRALAALLDDAQRRAARRLRTVRIIPQCHKVLKVR